MIFLNMCLLYYHIGDKSKNLYTQLIKLYATTKAVYVNFFYYGTKQVFLII